MAEYKAGARKREPTHPGKIVASSLRSAGINPRTAAIAMGITPMALHNVINGKSAVSPAMALRLGRFFDNGPQLWLGLQSDHDLWREGIALEKTLATMKTAKDYEPA